MTKTRSRRRTAAETKRRKLTVTETIKEDVEEAEGNAEIANAAVVVVAVTIETTNTQKMLDQVQMTIVLSTVDISGASVTRVLEEMITIPQEEVAEMGKDVVTLIQAVVTVVEEVTEVVVTTTTVLVTTKGTSITTWMVRRNKELRTMAKELINSRMLNTII
jgi:cob(I)alamin adenosyltransferase